LNLVGICCYIVDTKHTRRQSSPCSYLHLDMSKSCFHAPRLRYWTGLEVRKGIGMGRGALAGIARGVSRERVAAERIVRTIKMVFVGKCTLNCAQNECCTAEQRTLSRVFVEF